MKLMLPAALTMVCITNVINLEFFITWIISESIIDEIKYAILMQTQQEIIYGSAKGCSQTRRR